MALTAPLCLSLTDTQHGPMFPHGYVTQTSPGSGCPGTALRHRHRSSSPATKAFKTDPGLCWGLANVLGATVHRLSHAAKCQTQTLRPLPAPPPPPRLRDAPSLITLASSLQQPLSPLLVRSQTPPPFVSFLHISAQRGALESPCQLEPPPRFSPFPPRPLSLCPFAQICIRKKARNPAGKQRGLSPGEKRRGDTEPARSKFPLSLGEQGTFAC